MHRILQDVQQLRSLAQQQAQIAQQYFNLCNRIEQTVSQIQFAQSQVNNPTFQVGQAPIGIRNEGQSPVSNQGYNPTAFSQVMQTESQFQPSQLYGRQTQ
jgi:hypothetical protein